MKDLIKNLLSQVFPYTVDSAIKRFERDVARLNKIADNHSAAADAHFEAANDFVEFAKEHQREASRAARVATRVAALID